MNDLDAARAALTTAMKELRDKLPPYEYAVELLAVDQSIRESLAAQDAEIARLRAQAEHWRLVAEGLADDAYRDYYTQAQFFTISPLGRDEWWQKRFRQEGDDGR